MEPNELSEHPLEAFGSWFSEAVSSGHFRHPEAMTLATVDVSGRPSARIVLLKEFSPRGFVFFTNYESRKGAELAQNSRASLVFYWDALERQVRIEGTTERISREESQDYFNTRPRGSQYGAWASPQSQEIDSREELEARVREAAARYSDAEEVPVPPHWGGYVLVPDRAEFWRQRPDRLHDRCEYFLKNGQWKKRRLAP